MQIFPLSFFLEQLYTLLYIVHLFYIFLFRYDLLIYSVYNYFIPHHLILFVQQYFKIAVSSIVEFF
jgi:hypothetical protein